MKSYFIYIILIVLILACTESTDNSSAVKKFVIETDKYDTIYTVNSADNTGLINELRSELQQANFTIEERKIVDGFPFYECERSNVKFVGGDGIREYFTRSKIPEEGTGNLYPDFVIWVFEFPSDDIARQNYNILEKVVDSASRQCLAKAPERLEINGNEVFLLETRAERFRTYIDKYGELIKNYRQ